MVRGAVMGVVRSMVVGVAAMAVMVGVVGAKGVLQKLEGTSQYKEVRNSLTITPDVFDEIKENFEQKY